MTVSFHYSKSINMVKILPLLALAAIVLKQNLVAAGDLYEKQQWHPCKTDLTPTRQRHLYYDFTPPNCVLINHTTTEGFEYFSCRTKLQECNEVVYFGVSQLSVYFLLAP
jgi:hypothetical protein